MGQILSWIWTAGTKGEELVSQGAELFQRFCVIGLMTVIFSTTGASNGASTSGSSTSVASSSCNNPSDNESSLNNETEIGDSASDDNSLGDNSEKKVIGVKNAPSFYSDNCCFKWIKSSWPVQFLANLLDTHHLIKRYFKAVNRIQPTFFYQFCQALSKCFGQNELGVLFPPEKIIALIKKVKDHFEQPEFNVWNNETTKTHEIEKELIRNNSVLPKDIYPTQCDRFGKVTVKIGTNKNESLHGYVIRSV
jgi:hypothetical protein